MTADPVIKQLDDDCTVCDLRIAVNDVKDQDSKTTLEIYATVQKRLRRPHVKRAFDALLASSDLDGRGWADHCGSCGSPP